MADANSKLMKKQAEDEALSALLDGELSQEQEEGLRRRMADDPRLAERCAEFAEVGGTLQSLASATSDPERLQRIRQGLQARIDADELAGTQDQQGARVIPFPRGGRGALAAVAALAAALALYLAIDSGSELEPAASRNAPILAEAEVAIPEAETPVAEVIEPTRLAASPESGAFDADRVEALPSDRLSPGESPEGPPVVAILDPTTPVVEAEAPLILPDADEQLAIALEYGMLADFDVISNLELLESLDELVTMESM